MLYPQIGKPKEKIRIRHFFDVVKFWEVEDNPTNHSHSTQFLTPQKLISVDRPIYALPIHSAYLFLTLASDLLQQASTLDLSAHPRACLKLTLSEIHTCGYFPFCNVQRPNIQFAA